MISAGTRIAHYVIRSRIGAGAVGEVFRADDEQQNRAVALKILSAKTVGDPKAAERFQREAKAIAALKHPNIVDLFDIGQSEFGHFMVMEMVEGRPLRFLIGEKASVNQLIQVGRQLAQALNAIHALGLVHRDVKPENIMVQNDGAVKLLDFGLARLVSQENSLSALQFADVTTAGVVIGTARYMSPEQARGDKVSTATDIFSLGIILFEWATGQHPFGADLPMEMLRRIMSEAPPPLARWRRDLPPAFGDLIQSMLSKEPEERPTAAEVDRALAGMKGQVPDSTSRRDSMNAGTTESVHPPVETSRSPVIIESIPGTFPMKRKGFSTFAIAAAGVVLAAVALFFWLKGTKPERAAIESASEVSSSRDSAPSVAVLPFVNMSPDKTDDYLGDGMTEELLNVLAQVKGLRVPGRSSSFAFKGKNEEGIFRQVGAQLRVKTVLEGSVRKAGTQLRITAQLINVADGYHLWSDKYDRDMTNIFAIQSEVAFQVVEALKIKLGLAEAQNLAKKPTENLQAYELYLKGRSHWNKRTAADLNKAMEFFNQAIEKDPGFGQAHAGIASTWLLIPAYANLPAKDYYPRAKVAAIKALELDATLAEARAVLAMILQSEWNWDGAEAEYKRVIQQSPNYPTAHHWYGLLLGFQSRFDETLTEFKRAEELDPLSPVISVNVAGWYYYAGQYEEAIVHGRKTLEIDPTFAGAHLFMGDAYTQMRMFNEAISEIQKVRDIVGNVPYGLASLGRALALSGRKAEALKILDRLGEFEQQGYAVAYDRATVYSALGEKEKALSSLENSLHESDACYLKIDRIWADFRHEPRFIALLKKMGLEK